MRDLALGLDRVSGIGRVGPWAWTAIIVVSTIWLLGPRASGWQLLHLHKEDGSIFLEQWVNHGWSSMLQPYTGYQHLGARLSTSVCASGPVPWVAPCFGVAAGLFRFLWAVVAAAVLIPYARGRGWGMAAGLLFVLVPVGQQEVLGNLTNLRWFFDAGCLLACLGLFRGRLAVLAGFLGFVGAMSDPLVLLLLPVAAWRVATAPRRRHALPAVAVGVGACLHWALLIPSARAADVGWYLRDPLEAATQLSVRALAVAQFGQNGTEVLLHGGIVVAVAAGVVPLVLMGRSRPPRPAAALVVVLVAAGVGLLAATLVFAPHEELELDPAWQLGNASRYSLGPALLVGAALLVAVSHSRVAAPRWTAGALLVLAGLADLTGDSWNSHGPTWSSTVREGRLDCATGSQSVDLQLTPTDVPTEWRARVTCAWLDGS